MIKGNKDHESVWFFVPYPPPSCNTIWRNAGGKVYKTPVVLAFRKNLAYAAFGKRVPTEWPACHVKLWVRPKRNVGDVDNFIKSTLDAITAAGVWKDDRIVASVSCQLLEPEAGASCVVVNITRAESRYIKDEPWRESAPDLEKSLQVGFVRQQKKRKS